jgi:hypothetical protein
MEEKTKNVFRRRTPRLEIPLYARYQNTGPFMERRGNISTGGFCIEGDDFNLGQPLDVLFELPDVGFWIFATGIYRGISRRYAWPNMRGQFVEITGQDTRMLDAWIYGQTELNPEQRKTFS